MIDEGGGLGSKGNYGYKLWGKLWLLSYGWWGNCFDYYFFCWVFVGNCFCFFVLKIMVLDLFF